MAVESKEVVAGVAELADVEAWQALERKLVWVELPIAERDACSACLAVAQRIPPPAPTALLALLDKPSLGLTYLPSL